MRDLKSDSSHNGKTDAQSASPPLSIPPELFLEVERLADIKECSFDQALAYLVEKGVEAIRRELDALSGSSHPADLSPRQIAVLIGLRSGLAVKEIADNLKVSEATIRTHIIRIRERLGCADILELRIPAK